jgi:hypothetical protein
VDVSNLKRSNPLPNISSWDPDEKDDEDLLAAYSRRSSNELFLEELSPHGTVHSSPLSRWRLVPSPKIPSAGVEIRILFH